MKRMKCYGRKKVAESSFTGNFFDGNQNQSSLFDESCETGQIHSRHLLSEDKKMQLNAIESPVLFENTCKKSTKISTSSKNITEQLQKTCVLKKKGSKRKKRKKATDAVDSENDFDSFKHSSLVSGFQSTITEAYVSLDKQEVSKYLRKNESAKKLMNVNSNINDIFQCLNSVDRKKFKYIITSTPVVKLYRIAHPDLYNTSAQPSSFNPKLSYCSTLESSYSHDVYHEKSPKVTSSHSSRFEANSNSCFALPNPKRSKSSLLNTSTSNVTDSQDAEKSKQDILRFCDQESIIPFGNAYGWSCETDVEERSMLSDQELKIESNVLQAPILENTCKESRTCIKLRSSKKQIQKICKKTNSKIKRKKGKNSFDSEYRTSIQPRSSEFHHNFTTDQLGIKKRCLTALEHQSQNSEGVNAADTSLSTDANETVPSRIVNSPSIDVIPTSYDKQASPIEKFIENQDSRYKSAEMVLSHSQTIKNDNPKCDSLGNRNRTKRLEEKIDNCANLQGSSYKKSARSHTLSVKRKKEKSPIHSEDDSFNHSKISVHNLHQSTLTEASVSLDKQDIVRYQQKNEPKPSTNVDYVAQFLNCLEEDKLARINRAPFVKLDRMPLLCSSLTKRFLLRNKSSYRSVLDSIEREKLLEIESSQVPRFACNSKKSMSFPRMATIEHPPSNKRSCLYNKSTFNMLPVSKDASESFEHIKKDLLQLCEQESVIPFADAYGWSDYKIRKVGEGAYGEVFLITKKNSSSVLKIIPISQDTKDGTYQCLQTALSEIKISKCLSDLRSNKNNQTENFTKFNRVSLVSGIFPLVLIHAWDSFSEVKSTYNSRPDIFDDKQLYVILDLGYGGKNLACFVLRNAVEAESLLKQVAVSLAVAEEEFHFEHRDLHLGNVLVKRNRRKTISFKLKGQDITFQCYGLQVTIIDFTLSRLLKDGEVLNDDLENNSLYDKKGELQFEVYSLMKLKLCNQWQECSLNTNILWLNFISVKISTFKFSRPETKAHKEGLKAISRFKKQLINCNSAISSVMKCGISTFQFEIDPNDA